MKNIKLYLTLLSILLFSINALTSPRIKFIYDAAQNTTILPVDLEDIDDEFIYYYFNFTCHGEFYPDSKDTAFFSMQLDEDSVNLMKSESVSYLLNDLEYEKVDIDDIEAYNWTDIKNTKKDKMEYFYKISRKNEASLFLKVGTNNVKKGSVTMSNVDKIPSGNSIAGNIQISKLIWIFFLILNIW